MPSEGDQRCWTLFAPPPGEKHSWRSLCEPEIRVCPVPLAVTETPGGLRLRNASTPPRFAAGAPRRADARSVRDDDSEAGAAGADPDVCMLELGGHVLDELSGPLGRECMGCGVYDVLAGEPDQSPRAAVALRASSDDELGVGGGATSSGHHERPPQPRERSHVVGPAAGVFPACRIPPEEHGERGSGSRAP